MSAVVGTAVNAPAIDTTQTQTSSSASTAENTVPTSSPTGLAQTRDRLETNEAPAGCGCCCLSSIAALFASLFSSCGSIFRAIGEALCLISPQTEPTPNPLPNETPAPVVDITQVIAKLDSFCQKWGHHFPSWDTATQGKEMIDEFHQLAPEAQALVRNAIYVR